MKTQLKTMKTMRNARQNIINAMHDKMKKLENLKQHDD